MSAPRQIRLDNADPATVRTVRRFDLAGELRSPHYRPDGSLIVEGILCREGVLKYRRKDGTVRLELVTAKAVQDTARTAAFSAMTLNHPPGGFVSRKNADRLATGNVDGETEYVETAQGSFARIKVTLRRDDAITAFEDGTARQLSPGYEVELEEVPGSHPVYGEYHASQIGRDVNHSAQVPKGRGDDVGMRADDVGALRLDSDDMYQVSTWQPPEPTTDTPAGTARTDSPEVTMKTYMMALLAAAGVGAERFDSEEGAFTEGLANLKKLRADMEETEKKVEDMEEEKKDAGDMGAKFEAMETENKKLKKDMEELQGKHDALFEAAKTAKKEKEDRADAAALTDMQALAKAARIDSADLDLKALRHKVAKSKLPSLPDDAGDGYINGVIAMVRADAAATPTGSGSRYSGEYNGSNGRQDGGGDDNNREDAASDEFRNPSKAGAAKQRADAAAGVTP